MKAYYPLDVFPGSGGRTRLPARHDTMDKASPKRKMAGPRIITVPPGPKSQAAAALRVRVVTDALRTALPVDLVRGEGPFVQDADGNVYIDLGVGIGVHNAGHRPRSVIRAAKQQLDRLTHISYMVATYGPYTELAERMAELSPPGLTKSIFLNSGSEAIENAIKIGRASTKKPWIVSFRTAFHGRTLLDISLTGKENPYREGFGPLVREVLLADYPYPYRDPRGRNGADLAQASVDSIAHAIRGSELDGRVGMLVAEPVQGEGGIIVPPKEFFPLLRELCDDRGIVLIDDEVQAGMGRTGKLWAIEHWDTVPDLLVSGKALGGGLPLGAVTGRPEIMDAPGSASLGGTFGGNPVVCAAGLAAIQEIQSVLPGVPKLAAVLRHRLGELEGPFDRIGEVRGIGAMWAIEFVKDRATKEPDSDLARAVQMASLRSGLVLLTAGFYNNCVRLLPPLNIPIPLMERALDLLEDSIKMALAGKG